MLKEEFDDVILKTQHLLEQYAEDSQHYMIIISSQLFNDMSEYIKQNYFHLNDIQNILNDDKVQTIWRQDSYYMYNGFRYHGYSDGLFHYAITNKGKLKHWSLGPRTAAYSDEFVLCHIQTYGHEPGFKCFGYDVVDREGYYIGLFSMPKCVVGNIL